MDTVSVSDWRDSSPMLSVLTDIPQPNLTWQEKDYFGPITGIWLRKLHLPQCRGRWVMDAELRVAEQLERAACVHGRWALTQLLLVSLSPRLLFPSPEPWGWGGGERGEHLEILCSWKLL